MVQNKLNAIWVADEGEFKVQRLKFKVARRSSWNVKPFTKYLKPFHIILVYNLLSAAIVSIGFSELKTKLPATKTSAPSL